MTKTTTTTTTGTTEHSHQQECMWKGESGNEQNKVTNKTTRAGERVDDNGSTHVRACKIVPTFNTHGIQHWGGGNQKAKKGTKKESKRDANKYTHTC